MTYLLSYLRRKFGQEKHRWFLNLQNFEFEIQAVRSELARLEGLYSKDDEDDEDHSYQRGVLEECRKLIDKIERAFDHFFPRELFIWQTLFLVQQRFWLIVPFSELPAKWATLNKRLQDLPEKEGSQYKNKEFVEDITTRLAKGAPLFEGADSGLRSEMVEVRRYLDDKVALEFWIAFRLRRYSVMFLLLAIVLVAYLVADICILRLECLTTEWSECADSYSIVAMIVAGSLGALISALSSGLRRKSLGKPPLVQAFFVRPVIGGIAGLFVYLLAQTGTIDIPYPGMYLVAIAFGFSERALYRVLGSVAGSTESRVARLTRLE